MTQVKNSIRKEIISNSVMGEISGRMRKCGAVSPPSEVHGGGGKGPGWDGGETALYQISPS